MVTLKMIADQCGLSCAAVSKALNYLPGISEAKAEMVREKARELGYTPNAAAVTLKTNRSHNIGILFENGMAHEFFSQVLEAIRTCAEERGYDITLLGNRGGKSGGYYEHAMRRQCDGVIIAQNLFDADEVQRLADSELPVVSIDQVFSGRTAVLSKNIESTREIVHYLYERGHRKIAYIHGELGDVTKQRLAGFYRGLRDCGLEVPPEYVIQARFHEPRDSGLATRQLLQLADRPTSILYPDDISYLGGLTEIESQGLSVPGDVSCFGYDGIRMAGALRPSLATYRQNAEEIGRTAMEQLLEAVEHEKYFAPEIITVAGRIQEGQTVRDLRPLEEQEEAAGPFSEN